MTHQPHQRQKGSLFHRTELATVTNLKKTRNRTMSQPSFVLWTYLCFSLIFLHTHPHLCDGVSVVDLNLLEHGEFHVMTKRVCTKSISECLTDPQMDSETNRRLLAMQKKFISYETLRRDMVPCDRAGASYYNCHATQANPYNRGCEVITGCARGTQGGLKTVFQPSDLTKT